jgi:hypothetical protein
MACTPGASSVVASRITAFMSSPPLKNRKLYGYGRTRSSATRAQLTRIDPSVETSDAMSDV